MEGINVQDNMFLEAYENYRTTIELSEMVFHDLKNILANISGLAQLSMLKTESREVKGYLNRINQATLDFKDVLDKYYKLINGDTEEIQEPSEVYMILKDALELAQFKLENININKIGVELLVNIRSGSRVICCKYGLRQCFLNIIINALDAMKENGGTLTIDIYDNDDNSFVCVDITDTGTGISDENIDRIFESKFTTKPEGTGLGLKIAKECIEEIGGTIKAISKVDVGTKISMSLPIYEGK